jgi:hypothetical protein
VAAGRGVAAKAQLSPTAATRELRNEIPPPQGQGAGLKQGIPAPSTHPGGKGRWRQPPPGTTGAPGLELQGAGWSEMY